MKKIFSLSYKLVKKILLLKNSNAFKMFSITISVLLIILFSYTISDYKYNCTGTMYSKRLLDRKV